MGYKYLQACINISHGARLNKTSQRPAAICVNKAVTIRTNAPVSQTMEVGEEAVEYEGRMMRDRFPQPLVYASD